MQRKFRLSGLFALFVAASTCGRVVSAQSEAAPPPQHYYLVDGTNNLLVQMDDMAGKNTVALGGSGPQAHRFAHPTRLFVDAQQRIYLCDSGKHRIVRVDDITGKGWTEIGDWGSGEKQFKFPVSIHVDANGRITVLDLVNTRIVQMDDMTGKNWRTLDIPGIDLHSGEPHAKPGKSDSKIMDAAEILNVVVDTQGRLYYPDQKFSCIRRFDDISGKNPVILGTPRAPIMQNGAYIFPTMGKGEFTFPQMLGLDSQDRLYVLNVPGYLVRVDDITGKNWTYLYSFAPGIANFSIVGGNTLYAKSWGNFTDIRTETPDGKTVITKWKPPLNWIVEMCAR